MFRPIRSLIMILIAFVVGMLFEDSLHRKTCLDRGGEMSEGLCFGAEE